MGGFGGGIRVKGPAPIAAPLSSLALRMEFGGVIAALRRLGMVIMGRVRMRGARWGDLESDRGSMWGIGRVSRARFAIPRAVFGEREIREEKRDWDRMGCFPVCVVKRETLN